MTLTSAAVTRRERFLDYDDFSAQRNDRLWGTRSFSTSLQIPESQERRHLPFTSFKPWFSRACGCDEAFEIQQSSGAKATDTKVSLFGARGWYYQYHPKFPITREEWRRAQGSIKPNPKLLASLILAWIYSQRLFIFSPGKDANTPKNRADCHYEKTHMYKATQML